MGDESVEMKFSLLGTGCEANGSGETSLRRFQSRDQKASVRPKTQHLYQARNHLANMRLPPRFTTNPFQTTIWASTPPQIGVDLGGGTLLFCISIGNISWKKFLHWKLLDNICSSELKQNHRTKSYTCEFEKFSCSTFPLFSYF